MDPRHWFPQIRNLGRNRCALKLNHHPSPSILYATTLGFYTGLVGLKMTHFYPASPTALIGFG